MKKKMMIGIIAALTVVSLGGCSLFGSDSYSEDGLRFKEEYAELNGEIHERTGRPFQEVLISEDNPIQYATAEEIIDLIENGTGVIYFGFPQCPWCRTAVPALLEAAEIAGIETILYLNMTYERDIRVIDEDGDIIIEREGTAGYQRIQALLYEYLMPYILTDEDGNEVDTGERRIYVPFVVVIRNGQVVGHHFYTLPIQDEDPFMVFNESQHQELRDIYINIFNLLDACDLGGGC